MPSLVTVVGVFAVGVLTVATSSVHGMPSFLKLIPGAQNVPGVEAIGHVLTGGGGARNAFGQDFEDAGTQWNEALCYKDSDGDGQFNGAELGDPCCEWVQSTNEKIAYTTATAPGDKTSKQDPKIWATVTCAHGVGPDAKYTAYTKTTTAPSNETKDAAATTGPTPTPAAKSGTLKFEGAGMISTAAVVVVMAVGML